MTQEHNESPNSGNSTTIRSITPQVNNNPNLVPFYDFESNTTRLIPKYELSPGCVWIRIGDGPQEAYAIPPQSSLQIEFRHGPFQRDQKRLMKALSRELADVHPLTPKQWEEGFRKDTHPDREIAIWVDIASILKGMTARHRFGKAKRAECFHVLTRCFSGERSTVRARMSPLLLLDEAQIEETIESYYSRHA